MRDLDWIDLSAQALGCVLVAWVVLEWCASF